MAQMLSQIPPGTNLFPYLGLFMNQTQRENLTTLISNRLSAFGEATLITAASAAVLSIYALLGMNTSSFQLGYMLRIGLLMLLVTISAMLCTIGVGYLSSERLQREYAASYVEMCSRKWEVSPMLSLINFLRLR